MHENKSGKFLSAYAVVPPKIFLRARSGVGVNPIFFCFEGRGRSSHDSVVTPWLKIVVCGADFSFSLGD